MDGRLFLDGAVQLPEPQKNPVGRPTTYSKDIGQRICELVADGATLLVICGKDGIPSRRTIFRWAQQHPEFDQMFQEALRWRCEMRADEILEIADNSSEEVARSKLRIDARFRLLAKEHPRKYGANPDLGRGGGAKQSSPTG